MNNSLIPTQWKRYLPRTPVLICWLVLIALMACSYAGPIWLLVGVWWTSPDYGHGFFVPLFSLVLLWARRDMIGSWPTQGSWWGLAFLGLGAAMRWTSAYFFYQLLDPLALVPWIAGLTLFIGGWRAMRWAWPSIVFLVFMVPLPGFLSGMLSGPLQWMGTRLSVYIIQTMGIAAVAQGNVIKLQSGDLGVVEACSGLRMLMLFFAVCVGAAFLIRCTLWERIVMVVSAVPIAIFSNVCRITVTAFLHEMVSTELADKVFHDGAGLLMMPLAMAVLWGEMTLLKKLLLEPVADSPISLSRSLVGGSSDQSS